MFFACIKHRQRVDTMDLNYSKQAMLDSAKKDKQTKKKNKNKTKNKQQKTPQHISDGTAMGSIIQTWNIKTGKWKRKTTEKKKKEIQNVLRCPATCVRVRPLWRDTDNSYRRALIVASWTRGVRLLIPATTIKSGFYDIFSGVKPEEETPARFRRISTKERTCRNKSWWKAFRVRVLACSLHSFSSSWRKGNSLTLFDFDPFPPHCEAHSEFLLSTVKFVCPWRNIAARSRMWPSRRKTSSYTVKCGHAQ